MFCASKEAPKGAFCLCAEPYKKGAVTPGMRDGPCAQVALQNNISFCYVSAWGPCHHLEKDKNFSGGIRRGYSFTQHPDAGLPYAGQLPSRSLRMPSSPT